MSLTTIQLTQFQVERLQCIGGGGRAAPYRITTYRSTELGSFGKVMETAAEAGNASNFRLSGFQGIKRLLSVFSR